MWILSLQDTAQSYSRSSLWGNWLEVLEAAMAKLLVKAVPAQHFAQQLVATALQPQMPRYWVGPCAGVEWLLRFFPLWLQVKHCLRCIGYVSLFTWLVVWYGQLYGSRGASWICC